MSSSIAKNAKDETGNEGDQRLSYPAAESYTGIKRTTLYALVHQGRIPHIRLSGRLVLFSRRALDTWLADHAVEVRGKNE